MFRPVGPIMMVRSISIEDSHVERLGHEVVATIDGVWRHRSLACPPHTKMHLFKNSKRSKSPRPSQQPASLATPSHVATGSLGFDATLDLGIHPEGALLLIGIRQPMGLIRLRR